jgi:aminopeptidase N
MFPEYDMDTRFATETLHGPGGALIADAKLTSHPIEVLIPTESTIGQVFDAVTYQKAGSCTSSSYEYSLSKLMFTQC